MMQSLVSELAITFVSDMAAFAKGCGRAAIRALTAPIDRIANACDVAGVLPQRRSLLLKRRAGSQAGGTRSRRRTLMPSWRFLGDLT